MDTLLHWWPLLKVGIVFASMLTAIRYKKGLGPSILAGSLLMTLLSWQGPHLWASYAIHGLAQEKTVFLALLVGLIMVLSETMETTGQSERLMAAVRGWLVRPRLRLIFFPALIGLLPMPGGAVFSAPMLDNIARGMDIPRERLVNINYWFRHVWELGWPLYPGILLASTLADVPISVLVIHLCPGIAVCIGLGWIFLLRPGRLALGAEIANHAEKGSPRTILREGAPLGIAIIGSLTLEGLISALPGVPYELGVVVALVVAVVVASRQNGRPLLETFRVLFARHTLKMLFIILAIFVFKEVLSRAGVVSELAQLAGGVGAVIGAAVILPFLTAFVSGITIAFVGASFPLFLGMLDQMGMQHQTMAYVVLGMFTGFAGIMISPLHACFVLSCEYFKADVRRAWSELIGPSACLAGAGILYYIAILGFL
jgi:integral membrane protein (TIGR00529 family)